MKVKNKLSLQFTVVFALLFIAALTGIYFFVEQNRERSFYRQLDNRAIVAAQFYFAEDNLSRESFKKVLEKFPQTLPEESIRIYGDHLEPLDIAGNSGVKWDNNLLKQVKNARILHITRGKIQVAGLYYADNSGNFIIVVSATDLQGLDMIHEVGLILAFFTLASLLSTFFLGRIFAKMALAPIVKITGNLQRTRASSLDMRLPYNDKIPDEIDQLSLTINRLLEHLEQSFESQRRFISNASHELRTPITAILGEAEIALMSLRKPAEYQQTLNEVIAGANDLNNILNGLMEMVQAGLDSHEFHEVRLDELLWEIVDDIEGHEPGTKVTVSYNLPADEKNLTVQGSRRMLYIAIGNVLANAIKFSDGRMVYCDLSFQNNGVCICISDSGIGIGPGDAERIFQPFFRSDNALIYPGAGIGLSLTKNIINLHNGSVKVESALNEWTRFSLFFQVG